MICSSYSTSAALAASPSAAVAPRAGQQRGRRAHNITHLHSTSKAALGSACALPAKRIARTSKRPLAIAAATPFASATNDAATRRPQPPQHVDFLVIGSGIAGLSYALKVADYGTVAIVTKDSSNEGCTQYAQGGVCAVLDRSDSVHDHVRDTMIAGAFLNDPKAVEVVCREGAPRVLELVRMGAEFTRNKDGSLHLTKEGGHSNRRIVHAADMTGREVERALLAAARAHRNIRMYEHHLAVDLVVADHLGVPHCFGADVLDQRGSQITRFVALTTMLASGGAGQVYPNTTNPHVATGDGIAMAYRARAAVSNMEFVQFHPTALYDPANTGRTSLITEAVRGEGGILLNKGGERFMSKYDAQRMELAPRDIVARSIHSELMMRGDEHVWLDISHKDAHDVLHHFPNIAAMCSEKMGIDITKDPIPVVPAQHYTCGGVNTGLLGETSVQGLYACGEVACSGLHGANRLASNSLLEGLVFADRAAGPSVAHAEHALRSCSAQLSAASSTVPCGGKQVEQLSPLTASWVAAKRAELRETMWRHCGIVRTTAGLRSALQYTSALYLEAKSALKAHGVSTPLVELFNLATVADITVACALQRRESRGGHYVLDYPTEVEEERRPSMVSKDMTAQQRRASRAAALVTAAAPAGADVGVLSSTAPGAARAASSGSASLPSKKGSAKKKKAVPRDMSVRSVDDRAN